MNLELSIHCLLVQDKIVKFFLQNCNQIKWRHSRWCPCKSLHAFSMLLTIKKLQLELLVTITKKANCKDVGILLQHINFFSPKKKVQRIDYWQHLYNDDFFRQLDRIFGAFSQKLWPLTSHFATLLRIDSQVSLPLLFNLWQKKCAIFSLSTGLLSRTF